MKWEEEEEGRAEKSLSPYKEEGNRWEDEERNENRNANKRELGRMKERSN